MYQSKQVSSSFMSPLGFKDSFYGVSASWTLRGQKRSELGLYYMSAFPVYSFMDPYTKIFSKYRLALLNMKLVAVLLCIR